MSPRSADSPADEAGEMRIPAQPPGETPTASGKFRIVTARPHRLEKNPEPHQMHEPGPAFNCRYAKLAVEIAICDSSYLSSLDRRMSRTYYRVMNSQWVKYEDPALGRRIKRTHRRWIARRNACGYNEGCIARRYENYIPELRAHLHYGTD